LLQLAEAVGDNIGEHIAHGGQNGVGIGSKGLAGGPGSTSAAPNQTHLQRVSCAGGVESGLAENKRSQGRSDRDRAGGF